jgi:hypothetical protein
MKFWHLLIHRLDSDFFTHAIRACRTSADFLVRSEARGGGKRDILSVGRATATTLDCLWMRPRDPDADICPATETVEASTEECMAHQSCVPATDHDTEQSNPSAVARELAGLAMIKRRRSLWHGSREPTAQLGGQDKSRTVRPGRTAKECWQISAEAQCALSGRNVRSRETPAKSRFAAHCAKGSPDRSYDRAAPRVFRPFCSALVSWDTADISCAHSKGGARAAAWETKRPSRKNEGG